MKEEKKQEKSIRINKRVADLKHSTRRGADKLIEQGRVFINGEKAVLGDKVSETDNIEIRFKGERKTPVYIAYNKPKGIVTHSAGPGEKEIKDVLSVKDVFPIGRLDKDSSGLMILTNDGRITDRLLNPKFDHEKEYTVTVKEKLRSNFKEKMEAGVQIEEEKTRPCKVTITGEKSFKIILTEGKRHQIRRMCSALFQEVDTLKRIRVMNIGIGNLKEGMHKNIEGEELKKFLKSLGL